MHPGGVGGLGSNPLGLGGRAVQPETLVNFPRKWAAARFIGTNNTGSRELATAKHCTGLGPMPAV